MFTKINTAPLFTSNYSEVQNGQFSHFVCATRWLLDFLKAQMLLQHYIISEFNKIKSIIPMALGKVGRGRRNKKNHNSDDVEKNKQEV